MENILVEMDRVIEEIKEKELVIANVEGILKVRVEEMKQKAAEQTEPARNEIEYLKTKLRSLFDGVEKVKETKTQRKLTLLSGEIVIKKATQKIDYDKAKLLEYAKTQLDTMESFIDVKTVESFKWADYKSKLIIDGENIINTETGEAMTIDGLSILEVPEELVIK